MGISQLERTKGLAFALGLSLIAASCGGSVSGVDSSDAATTTSAEREASSTIETGSDSSETREATDQSEVAGDPRLTGEFATIDQGTFDLASLQGQDTVLWFWAPW